MNSTCLCITCPTARTKFSHAFILAGVSATLVFQSSQIRIIPNTASDLIVAVSNKSIAFTTAVCIPKERMNEGQMRRLIELRKRAPSVENCSNQRHEQFRSRHIRVRTSTSSLTTDRRP